MLALILKRFFRITKNYLKLIFPENIDDKFQKINKNKAN